MFFYIRICNKVSSSHLKVGTNDFDNECGLLLSEVTVKHFVLYIVTF